MPHALWALGRARIRGRRIIGYWAWELPRLPDGMAAELSLRARNLGAEPTSPATPSPPPPTCRCMWCRIRCRRCRDAEYARQARPAADALVVLNVFHLGSAFSRKNPLAAIAAFRRAFGDAPDRVLAIKLIDNGAQWARRELDAAIAGAANIRLIEGMLPEADMAGLMAAADIVISLHRSEGFGLVPAQAMALGKPVIATGWSGNLDFMNKHNSALVSYSLMPVHDPEGVFDSRRPDVGRRQCRAGRRRGCAGSPTIAICARASALPPPGTSRRSSRPSIRQRGRRAHRSSGAPLMSPPPRIAINGRFLTQRSSGVQRFATETIKAIDAPARRATIGALQGPRRNPRADARRAISRCKNIPLRRVGFFSGYAWEQFEFPLHAAGQSAAQSVHARTAARAAPDRGGA